MRRFLSSRWFGIATVLVLVAAVVLTAAGCQASMDKSGPGLALGTAADAVNKAGQSVQAVGAATGNPFTTLLGSILSIVGTVGASLYGGAKIAQSKVDAQDAKAFTPADVASIDAARAIPATPALKPVE